MPPSLDLLDGSKAVSINLTSKSWAWNAGFAGHGMAFFLL
jgi:hypothetical protein